MNQAVYKSKNKVRVVSATALFDGHDASINIIRRVLQDSGVEVIHLGHNCSVLEIVDAAIQEDVCGICVSSYQGGHIEFFKYMIDLLKERNAGHIKIFAGGGGVIVPEEIKELEEYGVAKIYSPKDGSIMGFQGMINDMICKMDFSTVSNRNITLIDLVTKKRGAVAYFISLAEQKKSEFNELRSKISEKINNKIIPVIGITGTGGAGKSSLCDELILRILSYVKDIKIAIISIDPTKRKSDGSLLGDRIRMNAIQNKRVYMRSIATRRYNVEVPDVLPDALLVLKAAGFDMIIVETAGIGQGNSSIIDNADISMYVMTSEFGAASQLEKIDMLDYADIVVINKFEKQGSDDAFRDVSKQVQRNKKKWDKLIGDMDVYGTIASKFNDEGVSALYQGLLEKIEEKTKVKFKSEMKKIKTKVSTEKSIIIPKKRLMYLSEIADTVRKYHKYTEKNAEKLTNLWHIKETVKMVKSSHEQGKNTVSYLNNIIDENLKLIEKDSFEIVSTWENIKKAYVQDEYVYKIRNKEYKIPLYSRSLSNSKIPKIAIPKFKDPGEIYRWRRKENIPGHFPFTAGVFDFKRADEDPTRMFAGEGDPDRTNRRFKLLSENTTAKRLSTAFDSVTLYGCDPDKRLDIYGKVGNSGVSVCSIEDIKRLYDGFELCSSNTSVSMTINGPAPPVLAMFLNVAIDQQIEIFFIENSRKPNDNEIEEIRKKTLENIRGTVQADILKEDQGQNTCIFSKEFALKMMGDIQEFFVKERIKNFYSVSISGYHIAEAGANPITQLALTLANGFTYVEYYLSRGMDIDEFAPSLSFFFSNGMDPEYTVIGRVARRIWAVIMRERYKASERSQKLKYHIQTSGRSLHVQEIQFNDIRTTLQALCAIYDNCNSLHTNAYDEAITTPSNESVRRALAIQMIINKEWGLAKCENVNQGSFVVEELTSLVEKAVLEEFDKLSERGGVLGAMETGYQRSKIQDESMYYENLKHNGKYPLVGVNMFLDKEAKDENESDSVELARATDEEKDFQIKKLKDFQQRNKKLSESALKQLKKVCLSDGNIFKELMETTRVCSLEQITQTLYEVGGKYRKNL